MERMDQDLIEVKPEVIDENEFYKGVDINKEEFINSMRNKTNKVVLMVSNEAVPDSVSDYFIEFFERKIDITDLSDYVFSFFNKRICMLDDDTDELIQLEYDLLSDSINQFLAFIYTINNIKYIH
ncbi:MAG: hypothetical protein ACRC5M_07090 [Anaeroplasmataceae bacterium]